MIFLSWTAVVLLLISSAALLISRDWRVSLGMLAVQYIGMFWLVGQQWPWSMAAIKLVTGWMAATTLGMTRLSLGKSVDDSEELWSQGGLFRVFAAGVVVLLVAAAVPRIDTIIPGISFPVTAGGILLLGMGLLHLGTTSQTLRVILGLLTVLSGFEIIYAALESSTLVTAMLAIVNLGLALVGSYVLIAQQTDQTTEENA